MFQLTKIWWYLPSQKPTHWKGLHFNATLENFTPYKTVQVCELIKLWMFEKFRRFGVSLASRTPWTFSTAEWKAVEI